mgnify:CR=1 FL=1
MTKVDACRSVSYPHLACCTECLLQNWVFMYKTPDAKQYIVWQTSAIVHGPECPVVAALSLEMFGIGYRY